MPLEYEEGFTPTPHFLETRHLKTQEKHKCLIGKTVRDIKCADEYGVVLIIFTDGTELEITGGNHYFEVEIDIPKGE